MLRVFPLHLLRRKWDALHGLAAEILAQEPQRALELRVTRRYVTAHGRYWYVFSGAALLLPAPRLWLFQRRLRRDACRVTERELETLLSLGWCERGVGFWLIAAGRRADLRNRMAEMAVGDEAYAMTDLGPAAACLGEDRDAETLARYLRLALPRGDEHGPYLALAALLHLDDSLGTNRAREFLQQTERHLPPSGAPGPGPGTAASRTPGPWSTTVPPASTSWPPGWRWPRRPSPSW